MVYELVQMCEKIKGKAEWGKKCNIKVGNKVRQKVMKKRA